MNTKSHEISGSENLVCRFTKMLTVNKLFWLIVDNSCEQA